jgi:uncharacterized lipoprotein
LAPGFFSDQGNCAHPSPFASGKHCEVAMKSTLLLAALLVVGLAACEDRDRSSGYGSTGAGTSATTPPSQPGMDPAARSPEDNPNYTYRPGSHNR